MEDDFPPLGEVARDTLARGREGHPEQGGPWYGVVNVRKIMYRVHMVRSMYEDDLFRLNTDVWLEHL